MKMEDVAGGRIKIGNTTYEMIEAKYNNTLVWPATLSYIILNATVNYSSGNTLDAGRYDSAYSGNYAYITGTVRVKRGQTIIRETTEYLIPTVSNTSDFNVLYDSSLGYYVIRGNNLGTSETYSIKSTNVSATYSTSASYSLSSTVTQERNTSTMTYDYRTSYDYSHETSGYEPISGTYTASISSSKYTSTQSACGASGNGTNGENILTINAKHYEQYVTHTPYTKYRCPVYEWTSGSISYGSWSAYETGVEDSYGSSREVSDAVTPTLSDNYFTVSGSNVKIPSEGTTVWNSGRSVLISINNNGASASVRIYQARNIVESQVPTTQRYYDTPSTTITNSNYVINTFTLSRYASANQGCAASGDSTGALLSVSASHTHRELTTRDWTDVSSTRTTYSSGAYIDSTPTVTDSGTETVSDTTTYPVDTIVPYFPDAPSQSDTSYNGFTMVSSANNNYWLRVASEGTDEYQNGRSAVIMATNGSASASVTIYQKKNIITSYSGGAITAMSIDGHSSPYSIDGNSRTLNVSVTGYRYATYSSNAQAQVSWNTWILGSSQSWAVVNNNNLTVAIQESTAPDTRSVTITAYDPDYQSSVSYPFTVNQASVLPGVTIAAISGQWVLGTIKLNEIVSAGSTYDVCAMVVVRKSAPSQTAHITYNIDWHWASPGTPPVVHPYSESGTQNIASNETLSLTPYGGSQQTYYGNYLKTSSYPNGATQPGLTILNVTTFNVWEG